MQSGIPFKGRPPLKSDISLRITVCVGAKNERSVGDLDTFITGICDGLMKADPKSKLYLTVWDKVENRDIYPNRTIAIDDDYQVVSIQAVKVTDSTGKHFYDVELEGE